jgi:hypothetical protein
MKLNITENTGLTNMLFKELEKIKYNINAYK